VKSRAETSVIKLQSEKTGIGKKLLRQSENTIIAKMNPGKAEINDKGGDSKIRRKSRRKRLAIWLLVDLVVAAILFGLLLYRPAGYHPLSGAEYEDGKVSRYLTHDLSPEIYNEAQKGKPFEVIVTEKGANDIVASLDWPKESEGVMLYAPAVVFLPGRAVLMGTADVRGVEFVITMELTPGVDEEGLLSLPVSLVKVGALNVTPLVKILAKRMYAERLASVPVDTEAWQTKLAASLLNDEPFEAVFDVGDRKIRVDKITLTKSRLVLHIIPL
jgi:hypothetical protein